MYSAAYAIGSAADSITVTRSGGVGSIGVVQGHKDVSEAMKQDGLKMTFIFAGKHKVDGNSYEPLPPAVKARMQSRIDVLYEEFVATVARNRGMEAQAVRDTEALSFTAPEAVENGLADSIGSLDDAVAAFAADLNQDEGDIEMSTTDTTAVALAAHEAAVTAARAEGLAAGRAEGNTAGVAAGVTAERARVNAILASDEAKARPVAALAVALDSDMSEASAKVFLGKMPVEAKATAATETIVDPLAAAMAASGGGAGVGAESGIADPAATANGEGVMALAKSLRLPGLRYAD
jgi:ClpP class serine protease